MSFGRSFHSRRRCEHVCAVVLATLPIVPAPPEDEWSDPPAPVLWDAKALFENKTTAVLRISAVVMSPRVNCSDDEDERPITVNFAVSIGRGRTPSSGTPEIAMAPSALAVFDNRPSADVLVVGAVGRCPSMPWHSTGTWYLQYGDTMYVHCWLQPGGYPEDQVVTFASDISYMVSYG
jgi:hypothetical protein